MGHSVAAVVAVVTSAVAVAVVAIAVVTGAVAVAVAVIIKYSVRIDAFVFAVLLCCRSIQPNAVQLFVVDDIDFSRH